MQNIGDITSQATKKNALPWPTSQFGSTSAYTDPISGIPQPYAGAAPLPASNPSPSLTPTTTAPTTVGAALQGTTNTVDQAKAALSSNQPFLDNYLKPNSAGTTPFRQALTNTKASTTADAYDNAISQTRSKAASMGFSSNSQPVTFGAEAGIANTRAKAIADIPNQVNLDAQPVEFQAAQMQQNQAPILNALANTQQGQTNTLEQQQLASQAQKAALTSGLANTAVSTAIPLIKQALSGTTSAGMSLTPAESSFLGGGADTSNLSGAISALGGGGAAAAAGGTATGLSGATSAIGPLAGIPGAGGALGATAAAPALAAPATGITGALGLGGGAGLLGLGAATIPVIGGALFAGYEIIKALQAHPKATEFVNTVQDPFANDKGTGVLNKVVDGFDSSLKAGTLDKATAIQMNAETSKLIDQFKQSLNAYSQQGGKENLVAHQAAQRMADLFGPNFEAILQKQQQEIQGLT